MGRSRPNFSPKLEPIHRTSTQADVSSLLAYTHPTDELHCGTNIRGHREHTSPPTALYLLPRDLAQWILSSSPVECEPGNSPYQQLCRGMAQQT